MLNSLHILLIVQINIEFNELENKIFNQLPSNSPDWLVTKFANVKQIINNTIDYDLDLRASTIALIEELT